MDGLRKLLVIDDEAGTLFYMEKEYSRKGVAVFGALSIDEARAILKKENPAVVVVETFVPYSEEFLKEVRQFNKNIIRVIHTTIHPPGYQENCFKQYLCEYYFEKPLSDEQKQQGMDDIITGAVKET